MNRLECLHLMQQCVELSDAGDVLEQGLAAPKS